MVKNKKKGLQYTFLIVKLINGKYENWGPYTIKNLQIVLNEASELPYVEGFVFSNNENEAKKRNRRQMIGLDGKIGRISTLRSFIFNINKN